MTSTGIQRGQVALQQFQAGQLSKDELNAQRTEVQAFLDSQAAAGEITPHQQLHLIDELVGVAAPKGTDLQGVSTRELAESARAHGRVASSSVRARVPRFPRRCGERSTAPSPSPGPSGCTPSSGSRRTWLPTASRT